MNVSTTNRKKRQYHRRSPERQRLIREIRDKLVGYYKPEKVILFGSHAYGVPHRESDFDLFIIKRTTKDVFERYREVSDIFYPRYYAMDILVRTPGEVRRRLALGDFFYKEILTKGRVLYEKK